MLPYNTRQLLNKNSHRSQLSFQISRKKDRHEMLVDVLKVISHFHEALKRNPGLMQTILPPGILSSNSNVKVIHGDRSISAEGKESLCPNSVLSTSSPASTAASATGNAVRCNRSFYVSSLISQEETSRRQSKQSSFCTPQSPCAIREAFPKVPKLTRENENVTNIAKSEFLDSGFEQAQSLETSNIESQLTSVFPESMASKASCSQPESKVWRPYLP